MQTISVIFLSFLVVILLAAFSWGFTDEGPPPRPDTDPVGDEIHRRRQVASQYAADGNAAESVEWYNSAEALKNHKRDEVTRPE